MHIEDNNTATVISPAEAQLESVLRDVQAIQTIYKNQRGKRALAETIARTFLLIEFILAEVDEAVQIIILDQHQVKRKAGTSDFTPWINCAFGEEKVGEKVRALDGHEYAPWEPNPSMAVYHHTMEELRASGFGRDSNVDEVVQHIMDAGGSQTMANARKKRLAAARAQDNAPTVERQRELYLADGPAIAVELPGLIVPEDAGAFISLVVERVNGSYVVRGVSDKNASGKLTKLAADAYGTLKSARDAAEEQQRVEVEAEERAYERLRAERQATPTPPANNGGTRLTPQMIARAKAMVDAKRNTDAAA